MTSKKSSLVIPLVVSCALFMQVLDGTIIATVLPQMARSFNENPVNVGIGFSAYVLTVAAFIPCSGWIADRFGGRRVFTAAIVVFTLSSALCGASHSLLAFTLARVLQGAGGALMVPVGRLVMLRTIEKADLVRTMSIIATPALTAGVLGPPLGGLITTYASWRWMFYVNVPVGLLELVLVFIFMKRDRPSGSRPFDVAGFVLSGSSLAFLTYGLDMVGRGDPNVALAAVMLALGAAAGMVAVRHARRAPHPMLDLSLLRIPTFATSVLWGGLPVRLVIGTTPFLWGLLFQVGLAMSALTTGLLMLAAAAGNVGTKSITTTVVRRFGFRTLLSRNSLLIAAGMFLCMLIGHDTPLWAIALLLLAIGITRSLQFTGISTLTYADIPPERLSAATSLASTAQQLAIGIGIALAAVLLRLAAFSHRASMQQHTLGDFRIAFCALGVVALLQMVAFSRLAPDAGDLVSGSRRAAVPQGMSGKL